MGLCGWIVFGFFAGLLARAIMPGSQKMGLIRTTLLGVGGAFVGGMLSSLISHHPWQGFYPSGFVGAVLGALALLVLGHVISRPRR